MVIKLFDTMRGAKTNKFETACVSEREGKRNKSAGKIVNSEWNLISLDSTYYFFRGVR